MTPKPLTDDQRRAAELLGQGRTQAEASEQTGISTRNLRRLAERDDFAALIEQARNNQRNGGDDRTSDRTADDDEPLQILREVMTGRNSKTGLPTAVAMKAAIAYANLRAAEAQEGGSFATVERVVLTGDDSFDAEVAAILEEKPANESVYIVIAARNAGERAAGAHIIGPSNGPWRPSRPDPPASPGDTPTDAERP
jgi:phage FluMu protein gp41